MARFISVGNTDMNVDHIVGFARPGNKATLLMLSIAGSPPVSVSETPENILIALQLVGAREDFIELSSTTLMVGKQWLNVNHIACIQDVPQGSNILLSKAGSPPETVRQKPDVVRALIRGESPLAKVN